MKHIAALLARAGIDELYGIAEGAAASAERDEPKQLDVLAVRLRFLPPASLCNPTCQLHKITLYGAVYRDSWLGAPSCPAALFILSEEPAVSILYLAGSNRPRLCRGPE